MKKLLIMAALLALAGAAQAQTPQPADWVVITVSADIAKPAYIAWEKVGGPDLCGIAKYLDVKGCTPISGRGEVGSLRNIALSNGQSVVENIVARTSYSYTYAQPFTPIFYHGTMTMEAVDPTHSRLVYTLIWNQAGYPDDKTRTEQREGRKVRFQAAVDKMAAAANAN
jgi:hypothetical protein